MVGRFGRTSPLPLVLGVLFSLTTLRELSDGHFTLAGLGNLNMTMAMQKSPRSAAAWWELMLRTVREALRTWRWEPEIQAWVTPVEEKVPEPPPVPASIPNDVVSFFSSPRSAVSPVGSMDAVPKPPVAAAERTADSA